MTEADRNPSEPEPVGPEEQRRLLRRAGLQALMLPLILGIPLFLSAGTLSWPLAWALLAAYVGGMFLTNVWLIARHPGLARERLIIPRSSERWDLRLIQITNFLLLGIMLPLAGLDHRLQWSPAVPPAASLAALILFAVMFLFMGWAMSANDFFSSAVRLQTDRGHTVATRGPYRLVRHPGYLGMIIQFLAIPVVLGALWTLVPASAVCALYVYRTDREDKLLMEKLPGYSAFTGRIRYHLIPGIW